ncbi:tyrosine-protein phosphatase [Sphingobium sp. KCTC 72723]|uniref:tyrosine-protein phosphatase n=1 Tax=Sphingobium sp. KCTC 72723 TaxID=2733867 RepID=UPI001CB6DACC|nr:tyrosine-protein phosphatase [Sphingobium sp. KCTC 72723]
MSQNKHILPTKRIHNFRDYGGYTVRGGGRLRPAMLFRSGEHSKATTSDLALVDDLALKAMIDLRSLDERVAKPNRYSVSSRAKILFSDSYIHARPPHEAIMDVAATPQMVRARLLEYYRISPFKPEQINCLRLYFSALIETDGATLVHCAAGKDRTGIAVALFHKIIGVEIGDIFADYLLTNEAGDLNDRIASFGYSVRAHLGDDLSEETLRISLSVEEQYLNEMFKSIYIQHESIEEYFRKILKFDNCQIDYLMNKFVV